MGSSPSDPGLIPLAVEAVHAHAASREGSHEVTVTFSAVEVYNEQVSQLAWGWMEGGDGGEAWLHVTNG